MHHKYPSGALKTLILKILRFGCSKGHKHSLHPLPCNVCAFEIRIGLCDFCNLVSLCTFNSTTTEKIDGSINKWWCAPQLTGQDPAARAPRSRLRMTSKPSFSFLTAVAKILVLSQIVIFNLS
jgi:hypothetical protein